MGPKMGERRQKGKMYVQSSKCLTSYCQACRAHLHTQALLTRGKGRGSQWEAQSLWSNVPTQQSRRLNHIIFIPSSDISFWKPCGTSRQGSTRTQTECRMRSNPDAVGSSLSRLLGQIRPNLCCQDTDKIRYEEGMSPIHPVARSDGGECYPRTRDEATTLVMCKPRNFLSLAS